MRRLSPARPCRHDGWTPDRQLDFLETLARTRNVAAAALSAGMSRESAYRLRARQPDGLFAAAWKRAMRAGLPGLSRAEIVEGHMRAIRLACRTESADRRPAPSATSIS